MYVDSAGLFGSKRLVINSLTQGLLMSYKRQKSIKTTDVNQDMNVTGPRLLPSSLPWLPLGCKILNVIITIQLKFYILNYNMISTAKGNHVVFI